MSRHVHFFAIVTIQLFALSLYAAADTPEPKAAAPNPPVVTAEESAEQDKSPATDAAPVAAVDPPPAVPIFDGSTLNGWRGYRAESPEGWSVVDGTLAFSGEGDDLITIKTYENFELSLEFKTTANTNSGIIYRIRLGDKQPYMSGPEYQIHTVPDADLIKATGSFYALYPSQAGLEKPAGEWNIAKIVAKGNRMEHWLNGTKIVDIDSASDEFKQKVTKSKFNGWPQFNKTKRGHIGLQDHGHPVWFRKVEIRELAAE